MSSQVRLFFKQLSHFVAGSAISVLLGLVTFPILTRVLTREEYGIIGLITTTMLIAVALAKAGLSNGIIRFFDSYNKTIEDRTTLASTVLIMGLVQSTCVVLIYLAGVYVCGKYSLMPGNYLFCFSIMAAYLFIRPLNISIMNLLRSHGKTVFLNATNLANKVTGVALSLVIFLVFLRQLQGLLLGTILAEFLAALVLFRWFFSNYRLSPQKTSVSLTLDLAKFGAPLLATELAFLLLTYADRYMILAYYGEGALGLYSAGYNMAMQISDIVTFSLGYAITPLYVSVFENQGREKTEEFLNNCAHYIYILIIPIFFGFCSVSHELFLILATRKFEAAASFSPIILLGSLLLGLGNIFNAGLYLRKKTKTILGILIISLITKIALTAVLLKPFGITGAAIATLAACALSAILTTILSNRYITIRFRPDLIFYCALSVAMFVILGQIHIGAVFISLFAKVTIGGTMILGPFLLKEKLVFGMIQQFLGKKSASLL